jgi:hypothetical protein
MKHHHEVRWTAPNAAAPPSGSIHNRAIERRAFEHEVGVTVYSITDESVTVNANGHVVCWPLDSARERVTDRLALAFLDDR